MSTVLSWDPQGVAQWVEQHLNLPYGDTFRRQQINGRQLMKLNKAALVDLGIPEAHAVLIQQGALRTNEESFTPDSAIAEIKRLPVQEAWEGGDNDSEVTIDEQEMEDRMRAEEERERAAMEEEKKLAERERAAREEEERERVAREQEEKELAERERAAREQEEAELAERERAAREEAEKEQLAKEQEGKDLAERREEEEEREKAAKALREQEERERAAQEEQALAEQTARAARAWKELALLEQAEREGKDLKVALPEQAEREGVKAAGQGKDLKAVSSSTQELTLPVRARSPPSKGSKNTQHEDLEAEAPVSPNVIKELQDQLNQKLLELEKLQTEHHKILYKTRAKSAAKPSRSSKEVLPENERVIASMTVRHYYPRVGSPRLESSMPVTSSSEKTGRRTPNSTGAQTPNRRGGAQTPNRDRGAQTPNRERGAQRPKEQGSDSQPVASQSPVGGNISAEALSALPVQTLQGRGFCMGTGSTSLTLGTPRSQDVHSVMSGRSGMGLFYHSEFGVDNFKGVSFGTAPRKIDEYPTTEGPGPAKYHQAPVEPPKVKATPKFSPAERKTLEGVIPTTGNGVPGAGAYGPPPRTLSQRGGSMGRSTRFRNVGITSQRASELTPGPQAYTPRHYARAHFK